MVSLKRKARDIYKDNLLSANMEKKTNLFILQNINNFIEKPLGVHAFKLTEPVVNLAKEAAEKEGKITIKELHIVICGRKGVTVDNIPSIFFCKVKQQHNSNRYCGTRLYTWIHSREKYLPAFNTNILR